MTTREKHDYRSMLEDLQSHPGEERVVWTRPLTKATARQAAAVAESLRSWIKLPHRGVNDRVECHYSKCTPVHTGEGDAFSRTDTGEATVVGRWDAPATEDDLATWLIAQIAADEADARAEAEEDPPWAWAVFRLAECDAKRRIIEIHKQAFVLCGFDEEAYPCVHLRLLALPYADRPGYRAEWAPCAST